MSYSQAGEDLIIKRIFTHRHDDIDNLQVGTLLDIGAWHPKQLSNSRLLIENGWSAVLIEPSPGPLRDLIREYADADCVHIISAAVGVERCWAELRITDDAVSSSVSGVHDVWRERGGYFGLMNTMTITIADILNRFGSFDFVNIDAEGMSTDLLFALLDTGCRPKCICVEHDGRAVEIGARTQGEYSIALLNDTNVILELAS